MTRTATTKPSNGQKQVSAAVAASREAKDRVGRIERMLVELVCALREREAQNPGAGHAAQLEALDRIAEELRADIDED